MRSLLRATRDVIWSWIHGDVFHKGRKVLVISWRDQTVRRGRVRVRGDHNGADTLYVWAADADEAYWVNFADYSIAWCWGWDGKDAEALCAQQLLVQSAQ